MTGNELVTTSDNRYLGKIIHDMTKGCLLTRNEFQAIIRILELAVDRMLWEAENEQTDRKEKYRKLGIEGRGLEADHTRCRDHR